MDVISVIIGEYNIDQDLHLCIWKLLIVFATTNSSIRSNWMILKYRLNPYILFSVTY